MVHDSTLVAFLVRQTLLEREEEKSKEKEKVQASGRGVQDRTRQSRSFGAAASRWGVLLVSRMMTVSMAAPSAASSK